MLELEFPEESSEDGTDKDKDASPTREAKADGQDAHGSEA